MYKLPSLKELLENTENNNHLFEVVSLFAGGGGSSTGYRMAGGKVLLVNEFIEEAQRTYKANYPSTIVFTQDIRDITPNDILDRINKNPYDLDILDGSPPCSAFSTAGKKDKGWGDKVKKYSDKSQSNIEDLFFEYIRILRGLMPKVFIAENVAGLATGAAKGYLNDILRELKKSGYHVECKQLDAKYLGVPQTRNRLIFVGVRNDLMKAEYNGKLHPKPLNYFITLEQAFNGLEFTEKDRIDTDLSKYAVYDLLKSLKHGEQHKKAFTLVKASKKSQSPCIKATTGKIGARESYHWDNRAFTVNEIKRIMSVPDDYILTGTYQQKVERLGRMVPPLMMKEVAEHIYNLVLKK